MKTKQRCFYVCLTSFSDEKWKNEETESLSYYGCLI